MSVTGRDRSGCCHKHHSRCQRQQFRSLSIGRNDVSLEGDIVDSHGNIDFRLDSEGGSNQTMVMLHFAAGNSHSGSSSDQIPQVHSSAGAHNLPEIRPFNTNSHIRTDNMQSGATDMPGRFTSNILITHQQITIQPLKGRILNRQGTFKPFQTHNRRIIRKIQRFLSPNLTTRINITKHTTLHNNRRNTTMLRSTPHGIPNNTKRLIMTNRRQRLSSSQTSNQQRIKIRRYNTTNSGQPAKSAICNGDLAGCKQVYH
mmetsp:Transcript_18902/g.21332  ORF Transcript_18902/g.21332 Transcript_18902/m.21332 type:complete len:257 (-) Transcript_18902:864-1634(-)